MRTYQEQRIARLIAQLELAVAQASDVLNGDVTGPALANIVRRIQGNPVSAVAPTDAQVLIEQAGGLLSAWKSLGKDVTLADNGFVTVVGLQGFVVLATTPLPNETLTFDGTDWGPQAPLGGTWHATVVHAASPFTPPAGVQLIPFDSSGGSVQVNTPAGPYDGQIILMKPVVASATPGTFHANNGGGETVEDPSNSGNFGANGAVPGQGPGCWWKYRASDKKWIGLINV